MMEPVLVILTYMCVHNSTFYSINSTVQYTIDTAFPIEPLSICRTPDEEIDCLDGYPLVCITIDPIADEVSWCSACDKGTYGSPENNCTACAPGFFNPDSGASACFECAADEIAESGSASCVKCPFGANTSSTCIQCTGNTSDCLPGFEPRGPCQTCQQCAIAPNCVHTFQCACDCAAGFERIVNECRMCLIGFFKNQTSPYECEKWDANDCNGGHFLTNGTRFQNSACLPCPDAPENATLTGMECEWTCDAGFNNTEMV